jgi:hypothetical protein
MSTPPQIESEGNKAYAAFDAYVQQGDNRSTAKVARQLSKSRQLITRWSAKWRWQARLAAQRQRECEQKIAAETKAVETVAQITEGRRARVAERAFAVAERMIDRADEVMEQHPVSSVRLLATGVQTISLVGGVASGYNVPAPTLEIVTQFIDQNGQPVAAPEPIENLSLDEIEALAAKCIRATEA